MDSNELREAQQQHLLTQATYTEAARVADEARTAYRAVARDAAHAASKDAGLVRFMLESGEVTQRADLGPLVLTGGGDAYDLPDDYTERLTVLKAQFDKEVEEHGEDYAVLVARLVQGFCYRLSFDLIEGGLSPDEIRINLGLPLEFHVVVRTKSPETPITGDPMKDDTEKIAGIYREMVQPYIDMGLIPNIRVEVRRTHVRDYELTAVVIADADDSN